MVFFTRSFDDMVSDGIQKLSSNTNITNLSPGAKARFILDTVYREQSSQFRIFDTNLAQVYLKYAEGKFLDLFGDLLNLVRLQATHAEDKTENFMFYVDTGVFGDVNSGADFAIPVNTLVSTVASESGVVTPGLETQPVVEYRTIEEVTCVAGESLVFAPVRARIEGTQSTVAKNVIRKHGFAGYAQSSLKTLKCTNLHAIQSGTDRERDPAYRFRLKSVFRARSLAVRAAIRLAALSVPGVSDIVDVNAEQGPSSFSLYVKGLTPTTSPRLLREVFDTVSAVTSMAEKPFVLAPTPSGLEFVTTVTWSPRATQDQIATGYAQMRTALENYLSRTEIGEEVIFADLIAILLTAAPLALRIGGVKPNQFDEVYVHRADPAVENSTTKTLVYGDRLSPLYNEIIILETSGRFRGIQFK